MNLLNSCIEEFTNKQAGYEFILESLRRQIIIYLLRNIKHDLTPSRASDVKKHVYVFSLISKVNATPIGSLTNGDGTYEIKDLLPGIYKLEFAPEKLITGESLSEWHDDKGTWREAEQIVVTPGNVSICNAVLE
ncbi:MAG: hypothetical protein JM58_02265 [Peptococcaceae bacterium BICA1-8]|nr:MAG: hypothetical protein JM58_02265 [Peptococcaceae bacterium BICA1-8]